MIKVDKMIVETEGTVVDIITELAVAMRAIGYKDEYLSKEHMHELVDRAYRSDEEIHEEAMQVLKERSKQLNDLVDIFEKLEELKTKVCENCPKKDTCDTNNSNKSSCDNEEDLLKNIFKDILKEEDE
jgi:hypothetical protein